MFKHASDLPFEIFYFQNSFEDFQSIDYAKIPEYDAVWFKI
jgi:hypothetical protein